MNQSLWSNAFVFFLSIVSLNLSGLSQNRNLVFQQLSQNDGLVSNNVNCVLKDSWGFMWFGTENGLSRYDGNEWLTFNSPDGLYNSYVRSMVEGQGGNLYVGTKQGLYRLNMRNFRIEKIDMGPASDLEILALFSDQSDNIWVGPRKQGLWCKRASDSQFRQVPVAFPESYLPIIYTIVEDSKMRIWLGTNDGLLLLGQNPLEKEAELVPTYFNTDEGGDLKLPGNTVWRVFPDKEGNLWLGIWKYGFARLNYDLNEVETFDGSLLQDQGFNSISISCIFKDKQGIIWIGSHDKGLFRYQADQKIFSQYNQEAGNLNNLSTNMITRFLEAEDGIVWITTLGGGVYYYSPFLNRFEHFHQEPTNANSLAHNYIFALRHSDFMPDGSFWVGTHWGGLNQLIADEKTGRWKFVHLNHEPERPSSLRSDVVLELDEDLEGNLWIATYGGLDLLRNKEIQKVLNDPAYVPTFDHLEEEYGLQDVNVFAMLKDHRERFWLGTQDGVYYQKTPGSRFYHLGNPKIGELLHTVLVRGMYEDRQHRIWIGTKRGIIIADAAGEEIDAQNMLVIPQEPDREGRLSNSDIICFQEDSKGRIWIGTEGSGLGIIQGDPSDDSTTFKMFTAKDGLAHNIVEFIKVDSLGRFWLGTNFGLSCVHPDSLLKPSVQNPFRNYFASDGLFQNEFNESAVEMDSKGNMYIGGMGGLNRFNPNRLTENEHRPETYFASLRILDQDIDVGMLRSNGDTILSESLHSLEKLNLSYRDYGFSIRLTAMDFHVPEKNQYAHFLEGFNEDWIYLGNERTITYTNLDPGDYTLYARATNHDGLWGPVSEPLRISISPPFWLSIWAKILYAVLFIGAVLGYIRYRVRQRELELEMQARIAEAKRAEREKVRKNTAADFHDELGNKMTKISLFVELAKRSANEEQALNNYLQQVEDQTQSLSEGMRDFIWVLDPEKNTLYDMLVRIKDFGDRLFEHSDIQFHMSGLNAQFEDVSIPLNYRRHIVLICKEALNNVLKYAQCKTVFFELMKRGQQFELTIKDDGVGFDMDQRSNGYGLKNMRSRAEKIGGIVNIQSSPGNGTQIKLLMDLPHMGD